MEDLPEAESEFLDEVTTAIRALYASLGSMPVTAFVKVCDSIAKDIGTSMVVTTSREFGSPDPGTDGLDIIRHMSIRLISPMSAIVSENWVITGGHEIRAEIEELKRSGRSISEHPAASEAVTIIAESDKGSFSLDFKIDRRHKEMTILEPNRKALFRPWDDPKIMESRLQFFHVPSIRRIEPEVIAFATEMDDIYGDPRQIHSPENGLPSTKKH